MGRGLPSKDMSAPRGFEVMLIEPVWAKEEVGKQAAKSKMRKAPQIFFISPMDLKILKTARNYDQSKSSFMIPGYVPPWGGERAEQTIHHLLGRLSEKILLWVCFGSKCTINIGKINRIFLPCLCSMIMSVVNCSVKMSVWGDGRDTDIEQERAEAVKGIE